jgi:hypothetical protein
MALLIDSASIAMRLPCAEIATLLDHTSIPKNEAVADMALPNILGELTLIPNISEYADIAKEFDLTSMPTLGAWTNMPRYPAIAHNEVLLEKNPPAYELKGAQVLKEPNNTNSPKKGCCWLAIGS